MVGNPMKIILKPDAKPFKISTARKTPKHWEKPADKIINELLESGVIARVDGPTDWCAPGFWVQKSDGKGIRLVIDLTKLNEYIVRPVYPFPSSMDVISSIDNKAKIFAKLDAVMSFHQIELDPESSFLM